MKVLRSPDAAGNPSVGDQIGVDLAAVDAVIGPFIATLAPGIGTGVSLGLKLLAVAEPAAYNAVAAAIQGTPLSDQQIADKDAAIARLQNPRSYLNS